MAVLKLTGALHRPLRVLPALLLGMATAFASPAAPAGGAITPEAGTANSETQLAQALDRFVQALERSARTLKADPAFSGDRDSAAGVAYWAQMLIRTLEEDIVQDADFPFFREVDFRIREGGDNPDQRYLFSPLRGGAPYRIWGHKAGERRLEIQIYAGTPWTAQGGRVVAVLPEEALHVAPDGSFEVLLGGEPRAHNWLANPPDSSFVMVRQIYAEWPDTHGDVHIDRVGYEGRLKPGVGAQDMVRRIQRAAANFEELVPLWPTIGRERFAQQQPNTLSPLFDPTAAGGVEGRWMSLGAFELGQDEALILTMWPLGGNYQGVQLTDVWTSSLEYANRQTSLTAEQCYRSADGAYRYIIAHEDPGVQNWLDTTGLENGYLLLRYDGADRPEVPTSLWPGLTLTSFSQARAALPPETPDYSAAARQVAIAQRRRHVQLRFNR
ncbi:DUF1214 domain-containing protein [Parahaliea mediterranea]|uniref:DUF1214 domain-containing protein n=1 Tax=Parahaliea mediterranea TaxID=651086 RepID=UPI0019D4CCDA|nr:DUF1214 domain-containing protein [Parahaliea mediterranea]